MDEDRTISIRSNASITTAAELMLFCDVDALGVVDEGEKLLGIVSERDLIRFLAAGGRIADTSVVELLAEPAEVTGDANPRRTRIVPLRDFVAREIMSSPGIACREETLFEEVAEILADREISGVPVLNSADEVVGVISERDLAHALGGPLIRLAIRRPMRSGSFLRAPRGVAYGSRRAKDIMASPPIVAYPETPMHAIAEIMVKEQINRVPIVRGKHLVGVVSRGDILAAIGGLSRRQTQLEEPPVVIGSGLLDGRFEAREGQQAPTTTRGNGHIGVAMRTEPWSRSRVSEGEQR